MACEHEADEVSLSDHGIGRRCGVVRLLSNEELYVPETEGALDSVGTALVLFAWPEEEEEGD